MTISSLLIPPPFDAERDDWGATLLAEWARSQVDVGTKVLIIGAGAGGIGLPLVRTGATVTFADDNISALAAAQLTFGQAHLQATFVSTLELAPAQPFDVALLNILWWTDAERGAELIELAARHVRPGGVIALGGGKHAGIGGAERDVARLVGPAAAVIYKKGHRVVATQRPTAWSAPTRNAVLSTLVVGGASFTVEHSAGVFAAGNLDPATELLIERLAVPANARVLDLGCGAGMIGMAVKHSQPSADITLVDSNVVAVALAQRNLAYNRLSGRVLASDGTATIGGEQFDLVVSNPPFHVGRTRTDALARRFISEAAAVLRPGGSVWVVANRFLSYEAHMEAVFGNVVEAAGNSRYKVLMAIRL